LLTILQKYAIDMTHKVCSNAQNNRLSNEKIGLKSTSYLQFCSPLFARVTLESCWSLGPGVYATERKYSAKGHETT